MKGEKKEGKIYVINTKEENRWGGEGRGGGRWKQNTSGVL